MPFLKLVSRFGDEADVQEYVDNLTKIGLSFILKEPLKWRNSLIVEILSKV